MKLTRLTASNVFKFSEVDIEFKDNTCLILANINGDYSQSNGVGKSAIIELVVYALFGKTIRGLNDISKYHSGKFEVKLEFDGHTIIRNEKKIKVKWKNGETQIGRKTEMQNLINNVIKLDFEMLCYTYIFDPENTFFLLDDGKKKDILMKLININFIDGLYDRVKKGLDGLKEKRLDNMIEIYENELIGIEGVAKEEKKMHGELLEIQSSEQGIKKFLEYKKDLSRLLEQYQNIYYKNKEEQGRLKKLKKELAALNVVEELDNIQKEIEVLKDKRSKEGVRMDNVCEKLDNFSNSPKCPTCDSDLSEEYRAEFKKKHQVEYDETDKKYKQLDNEIGEKDKIVSNKKKDKQRHDNMRINFESGKKLYYENKDNLLIYRGNIKKLATSNRECFKYRNSKVSLQDIRTKQIQYADMQAKYKMLLDKQDKLKKYKKANDKLKKNIVDFEIYKKIFSKDGLKQYAISKIVNFLEQEVNSMLIKIFADIEMKIVTDFNVGKRNMLKIKVNRKGKEVELKEFSKGERRSFEVIFQIAMYRLFLQFNQTDFSLMFFDEIFDPLDNHNSGVVIDILNLLNNENKSIFVVSHDKTIKQYFDKIMVVGSDGDNSWIEKGERDNGD